jgi:protein involved in polysaccharide export with SLBB domain
VSLDRLEALVRDTQSSRFSVITRGSFIVERSGRSELASAGAAITGQNRSVDETLRSGDDSAGLARARTDATLTRENDPGSNGQVTTGQADAAQLRVQRDSDRCPAVFEEEPELLPVLIESAVGVGGAVRRPGAYPIGAATSAAELAAVAGGIIGNGVGLTLDVTTSTGTEISQRRVATEGYPTALQQTILRSGDDLRFNSAQPQFEAGGVLLSGEFNRPGLYSIRKGETLSQLIARAGGLSPLAYPYGAIFTRRSVKEQQQEGLRRTGRELATSLLSVSARKESNAGALAAGQQLIQQLSTVEAPGRVVIEADPRVLAVRPDLDTVLESGDALVMPKRPNFVLALGDVSNPGALQFIPGKRAGDYLRESGGLQSSADGKRAFLVLPNGAAQPVSNSHGWSDGRDVVVPPGSTIIVPKNIDPLYKLDVARDVAGIVGGLIQSVATLAILATN